MILPIAGGYLLIAQRQVVPASRGPWLAVLLGLAVFAPLCLADPNDWLPLTYASSRQPAASPRGRRWSFATQPLNHPPLLLIASITVWRVRNSGPGLAWHTAPAGLRADDGPGQRPAGDGAGLVLGPGVHDMWGMPMGRSAACC